MFLDSGSAYDGTIQFSELLDVAFSFSERGVSSFFTSQSVGVPIDSGDFCWAGFPTDPFSITKRLDIDLISERYVFSWYCCTWYMMEEVMGLIVGRRCVLPSTGHGLGLFESVTCHMLGSDGSIPFR